MSQTQRGGAMRYLLPCCPLSPSSKTRRGSNQSSKRWELLSIAECESSGLLVTFFMAWSPGWRFNAGDSRLITTETTPTSIPTNPATGPQPFERDVGEVRRVQVCLHPVSLQHL